MTRGATTACAFGLAAVLAACIPVAAKAEPFGNWPTYASDPLTNWPKASEYETLITDLTWCYGALTERSLAIGGSTNGIDPAVGSVRQPETDIQRFKDRVEAAIPSYVDHSQAGSFTNGSSIPMLTVTGVLASLSLTNDFLDSTPERCLQDIVPTGWTSGYGMPGLKSAILALQWTRCRRNDNSANVEDRYSRGGSGQDPDWSSIARGKAIADYTNGQWNAGGDCYYGVDRYNGYAYPYQVGYFYWYSDRTRSKAKLASIPQIPDVGFDWDLYLEVNDWGTSFKDIDGLGFQNDKLFLHESGTAAALTTNVVSTYISAAGGDLDTSPIEIAPAMTATNFDPLVVQHHEEGCQVDYVDWLLKWDFQYDE